ncbi:DUF4129 domain-containing protein [Actinomycetospora rhizophila]|uniref:DUF4129 domain-containing protein n=1 Tax=Actinomycetospora rhizophila TaxID=1416876 RepID=A0ABV9ZNB3_9PSEU
MDPAVPVPPGAQAPAAVPIDIGADPARELAREELSGRIYQEAAPDPVQEVLRWIARRLEDLLRAASGISPGGGWGLLVLLVLLVVVIVVVRRRFGPIARTAAAPGAVLGDTERTADEHRRLADGHARAGAFDDAVRERMRAIVRSLEERTILEPRRGRTAGDAAREGGRALPAVADGLLEAARRFDETVYGGRRADADADARLRKIDAAVSATRAVGAA